MGQFNNYYFWPNNNIYFVVYTKIFMRKLKKGESKKGD